MKETKHKSKLIVLMITQVTRITFSMGFCLEQQTKEREHPSAQALPKEQGFQSFRIWTTWPS